jgi:hypothetical protein
MDYLMTTGRGFAMKKGGFSIIICTTILMACVCACSSNKTISETTESSESTTAESTEKEAGTETADVTDGENESGTESGEFEDGILFEGLPKTSELVEGNLSVNVKNCSDASYFCSVDGNIFFTDFTDNGYLYTLENGKKRLLCAQKACSINYYDGKVYFLSPDTIDTSRGSAFGDIYCYDTQTGECTLILEGDIRYLWVTEEGLYFLRPVGEDENSMELVYMDFEQEEQLRCYYPDPLRYGNYLITQEGAVDISGDVTTPSEESKIPFSESLSSIYLSRCIYNDFLIVYERGTGFRVVNLSDGTYYWIPLEAVTEVCGEELSVLGYTVMDDTLYVALGTSDMFVAVDLNTRQVSEQTVYDSMLTFSGFFTDGTNLYGYTNWNATGSSEIFAVIKDGDGYTARSFETAEE